MNRRLFACALGLLAASPVAAQISVRPVALQGQAPSGFPFVGFDDNAQISDDGEVWFVAGLGGVPNDSSQSLWTGTAGNLRMIGQANRPIPGDASGRRFAIFQSFPFVLPPHGRTTFLAEYVNPNQTEGRAVWRPAPGGPQIILERGTPAPGGGEFDAPGELLTNGNGQFVYRGALTPQTGGQMGIWHNINGSFELAARVGLQAPDTPAGTIFSSFNYSTNISASGRVLYAAGLEVGPGGVTPEDAGGTWKIDGSTTTLVARAGQPAPELPGQELGFTLDLSRFNRSGDFTLVQQLRDNPVASASGVFRYDQTGLHTVAASAQEAPAMGAGVTFQSVSSNGISDDRRVLVDALTSNGRQALYQFAADGGSTLLAASEMQIPSEPLGTRFGHMSGSAVNGPGQVAFFARIITPETTILDTLFMTDLQGQVHRVVGPGSILELEPGLTKTVFRISSPPLSSVDSIGSSFNDRGELVLSVTFTDQSEGIFIAVVPEPSSLLAGLALVACASRTLRRKGLR